MEDEPEMHLWILKIAAGKIFSKICYKCSIPNFRRS